MKTISFSFDEVNRDFFVYLLDYYDLRQKEKELKGKITSLLASNEQNESNNDDENDGNITFSEFCNDIVRKDFSDPIFGKMSKLFYDVSTDKLAETVFSTMDWNLGMNLPRHTISENITRLKAIVECSYTEKLPDSRFVEEFIEEIDKILDYFGLTVY